MSSYHFTRVPICKGATNRSIVWLSAKAEIVEWFQLNKMPRPQGLEPDPVSGYASIRYPTEPTSKAGGKRYRIAYEIKPGMRKPLMASFKLGHGHTRETLCLIARHLDDCGKPWLWLCNEFGNHLGGMWAFATPKP